MKRKRKARKPFAYKSVCSRCGNDIHPRARRCIFCRLKIKEPEDIIWIRSDQN